MCIIVYKPMGKELPDYATLKHCFTANPDGAGFMYPLAGKDKVLIRKGLMSFTDFYAAVTKLENVKDIPLVMHFRIGTQGFNDKRNTHPFPITSDEHALGASNLICDRALVHNGIIPLTTNYSSYNSKNKETRSDTFYFVRDYASLIIKNDNYYRDEDNLVLLERLAESKLCIMGSDGHVEMIGRFTEDKDDGCWYSNQSYWYSSYVTGTESAFASGHVYQLTGGTWEQVDNEYDRTIQAGFVPSKEDFYVLDENDGSIYRPEEDWFLWDKEGSVYLYVYEDCVAYYLPGVAVVDQNIDYIKPTGRFLDGFTSYKVEGSLDYQTLDDIDETEYDGSNVIDISDVTEIN